MTFWDSSAIVPLIVSEAASERLLDILEQNPIMMVWRGTPVECCSAVSQRERDGDLTVDQTTEALDGFHALSAGWHEIVPTDSVRGVAQRLPRVHPLRAADALQLAAAIIASEREPRTLPFLSLDERLNAAAQREGFPIPALV